ncbi:MAG: hypothetical protein HY812_03030 [Planctomycetes bacterium]|nr:hypothetical protein [Planctomycetota bacterium]
MNAARDPTLLVAMVLSCAGCEREVPAPPEAGSFRITWLDPSASSSDSGRPAYRVVGESIAVTLEYQGPRPWLEIVLENWEGPVLQNEEVLFRREYGALVNVGFNGGSVVTQAPPFTHLRQTVVLGLQRLREPTRDGENAFFAFSVFDPAEADWTSTDSRLARVLTFQDPGSFGQQSFPAHDPRGEIHPDSDEIWIRHEIRRDADVKESGMTPPFAPGMYASLLKLRFVDE